MYAAIRIGKAKAGKVGEVARRIEAEFLPTLTKMPGFVSYYLVELADDQVSTFTIFEDMAAAKESNQAALAWVKERLSELMVAPLDAFAGEVKVRSGR